MGNSSSLEQIQTKKETNNQAAQSFNGLAQPEPEQIKTKKASRRSLRYRCSQPARAPAPASTAGVEGGGEGRKKVERVRGIQTQAGGGDGENCLHLLFTQASSTIAHHHHSKRSPATEATTWRIETEKDQLATGCHACCWMRLGNGEEKVAAVGEKRSKWRSKWKKDGSRPLLG